MGLAVGPRVGPNTVLVGDASGVINPFNGEGIAYGYETGRLAAAALGEALSGGGPGALVDYERRLEEAYGLYFRVARAFVRIISRPDVMRALRRHRPSLGIDHVVDAAHHGQPVATGRDGAGRGRLPGPRRRVPPGSRVRLTNAPDDRVRIGPSRAAGRA